MRIHIKGDWAAAISCVLAGAVTVLLSYPFAAAYLIAGVLGAVAARRGRAVPDGSTWVSWRNANADGVDPVGVFGTVVALGMVAVVATASTAATGMGPWGAGRVLLMALLTIGGAWGVYQFTLSALVVVFTPDKRVIVLKGRPFILFSRTYRPDSWLGLHVAYEQGYSGGRFHNYPANIYTVWGVYPGGAIELNTVSIEQDVSRSDALAQLHRMVEETAAKTGLPVPPWPFDDEIYLRGSRSSDPAPS